MDPEWEHSMRCPYCRGLNDLDAEWCMQCSKRLRPLPKPVDMDAGKPTVREMVGGGLDVVAGDSHEGFDEGLRKAFAVVEDRVTWSCTRCGHANDVEASECRSCGRPFVEIARSIADAELPRKRMKATLKAFGIILGGATLMRVVAGLISPWAAVAVLGAGLVRFLIRFLRP